MADPTLPSVVAARAILEGQPGAGGKLAWSLLQRAAIVAPALWLAGEREALLKKTAVVVGAIELVVLFEVRRQLRSES